MISAEKLRSLKHRYKRKRDSDDSEWVDHWKDLADYILPRHGRFADRNTQAGKGDKYRHNKIINGTFGPYDPGQRTPPGVWAIVSAS